MARVLGALVTLFWISVAGPPAQAQLLQTPPYSLSLSSEWHEEQTGDPEQRSFVRGDVHLVVSSMAMDIPLGETERVAQFVVRRRLELEAQVAGSRGGPLAVSEPVVTPQPWGQTMTYHGSGAGRVFSFVGYVTRRQVLSTYVESSVLSEAQLATVFDEVRGGLRVRRG